MRTEGAHQGTGTGLCTPELPPERQERIIPVSIHLLTAFTFIHHLIHSLIGCLENNRALGVFHVTAVAPEANEALTTTLCLYTDHPYHNANNRSVKYTHPAEESEAEQGN